MRHARPAVVAAVVLAALVVASAALTAIGWPIWFHLILCGVPVFLAVRRRSGWALAFAVTVTGALAVLQLVLVLAARVHTGILPTVVVVSVLGAALACVALVRDRNERPLRPEPPRIVWFAALTGPVVWLAALALGSLAAGRPHISWTLRGDSANNLLIARDMVVAGGVPIGSAGNPAPLAPALIALGLVSGRRGSGGPLLETDIGAFALVWLLVIALACFVAGIVAAGLVVGRTRYAAVVAGLVSLLPLSWFVSGYQIEFGFFNADIVIAVALLCWLAFARAGDDPATALVVLLLSGTAMLGCWGPLAAVPAAFAVAVLARHGRALLRVRGTRLAVVLLAIAQLAVYTVVVAIPPALASGKALTAAGAIYVFEPWVSIVVATATVLLAIVRVIRRRDASGAGVLVMAAGLAVALGALLFLNRHGATVWTYYPVKCLWLGTVLLLILGVGLLAGLIADLTPRVWQLTLASVLAGAATVAFLTATQTVRTYPASSALDHAIVDRTPFMDDERLSRVARALESGRAVVYWRSGLPGEKYMNFWLLQLHAGLDPAAFPVRVAAYGLGADDTASLCTLAGVVGPGLQVLSADARLAAEVGQACPSAGIEVDSVPAH